MKVDELKQNTYPKQFISYMSVDHNISKGK